jgi:hypothetical protein
MKSTAQERNLDKQSHHRHTTINAALYRVTKNFSIALNLDQASSTFYAVRTTSAKFGVLESNMKFDR